MSRNARRLRGTATYEVVAHARDGSPKCISNSVLVIEGPDRAFHVVHLVRESPSSAPTVRRDSLHQWLLWAVFALLLTEVGLACAFGRRSL